MTEQSTPKRFSWVWHAVFQQLSILHMVLTCINFAFVFCPEWVLPRKHDTHICMCCSDKQLFLWEKNSKVTPYCVKRDINGISVSSKNKLIYVCHHRKVSAIRALQQNLSICNVFHFEQNFSTVFDSTLRYALVNDSLLKVARNHNNWISTLV